MSADARSTALFLGAFFDELTRDGVGAVVMSPGSRSTPLAVCAYELARCFPGRLKFFVDVDERSAAFFALGMAKASARPVALICTSGTAVANYYPAVLEAEASRIPLVILTGDRPPLLQGLGAPQTCDQLNAYGSHVRAFRQMPLPASDEASLAFARQAAREACIAALPLGYKEPHGMRLAAACNGAVVHLNFPFEEPLMPHFKIPDLFDGGRNKSRQAEGQNFKKTTCVVYPEAMLNPEDTQKISELLQHNCTLVLAGEGSCADEGEAHELIAWAQRFNLPLLADPLSGLRSMHDKMVIDNYDTVCPVAPELMPQVIIRFGRFPVSKKASQMAAQSHAYHVVVDPAQTRDFTLQTSAFIATSPHCFVRTIMQEAYMFEDCSAQSRFAQEWVHANDKAGACIACVESTDEGFEGAFVRRMLSLAPDASLVFAASSMSVRCLDTFYTKQNKRLALMCNRGLNGIDGTLSAAVGAAQMFEQTTLLVGDLALMHDANALALQRELRVKRTDNRDPSIVVIVLNNRGGAIFDMLPQKSDEPYFERLFLTPQQVDFGYLAQAFDVPFKRVTTVASFTDAYRGFLGVPGISLIEIQVPLKGLNQRYAPYWGEA